MHERDAGAATRFQSWRIGLTPESVDTLGRVLPDRLRALLAATGGDPRARAG